MYEYAKSHLLRKVTVQNLLSFGPDGMELELEPLNVLIGPNGSGKSNFLEVISLFENSTYSLAAPVRENGGIRNWLWHGRSNPPASAEIIVSGPKPSQTVRHKIAFTENDQRFELVAERIEDENRFTVKGNPYYRFENGRSTILDEELSERSILRRRYRSLDESILSQWRDPDRFPTLYHLYRCYRDIRLYRDWDFGTQNILRVPQRTDVRPTPLDKDFINLGMFLNKLRQAPRMKAAFIDRLSDLYEGLIDFELYFEGGTMQIFFQERDFAIPAVRLSDGSLRYLCMLALLLDPDPPSLIAIEEPELGMHPDLISKLAELLVDASTRCQLIITTHSDILVTALSDQLGSIVVCEKNKGQTTMNRLNSAKLEKWLERYTLGELWTRGEFGGVRW